MSCLRLYSPRRFSLYAPYDSDLTGDCTPTTVESDESGPVILRFPARRSASSDGDALALLERTRVIHENRCCPECGRATALPVDQEPERLSQDHMPIPGAGTLVGFRCLRCHHEWGIAELAHSSGGFRIAGA